MAATSEDLQGRISHFQKLKENKRHSMLNSVSLQFRHMAQGGDGTAASEGEIRKQYYPTWSTKDFRTVCKVMGWDYSGERLYDMFRS
jgi:hypothetical protein|tara:strand:+ start:1098 stop:1358 length:261 start_codon:yes stop_codon:yes gene_type:complete